jgi:hypothetical protein
MERVGRGEIVDCAYCIHVPNSLPLKNYHRFSGPSQIYVFCPFVLIQVFVPAAYLEESTEKNGAWMMLERE